MASDRGPNGRLGRGGPAESRQGRQPPGGERGGFGPPGGGPGRGYGPPQGIEEFIFLNFFVYFLLPFVVQTNFFV